MTDYGMAVFPNHAALLEASGVSVEVAQARTYRSADNKAQLGRLGFGTMQRWPPGLLLPVWSPVTKEIAGWQLRSDEPRADTKRGRAVKYETATGRPMAVDANPHTWPALGDPTVPLFITEGIRKADSAVSVGLCCVAILGVWNWRGKNDQGGTILLPEWDAVALNARRPVYIVFDSDVMTNPMVHQAMARLKAFLEHRGAVVALVYLPAGPGGTKVGLDDYLVAGHDVDDLLALASAELRPVERDESDESDTEPEDTFDDVADEAGADLLDDVAAFINRFVAFPRPEYLDAVALWVAHAHAVAGFDSTPRLAVLSPKKQSGKTRTLEVIDLLVPRSMLASSCSAAAMFRSVAARKPTVLFDEVDAIFGAKAGGDHEDLRALINAGHRKGATVARCGGDSAKMDVQYFPVYAAMALAGIGDLPDTILDRAVILRMRRRAPGDTVEPFRRRLVEPDGVALRRRLAAWSKRNQEVLADHIPVMPDGITDRPADVWEPLLAVAAAAGKHWPAIAATAAVTMVAAQAEDTGTGSLGLRLLADIKTVFEAAKVDRLSTADLIKHLLALEESPWGDLRGKALNPNGLAYRLRPYEVRSKNVRIGTQVAKGYEVTDFHDAWARYFPLHPPQAATAATDPPGDNGNSAPTSGYIPPDPVAAPVAASPPVAAPNRYNGTDPHRVVV